MKIIISGGDGNLPKKILKHNTNFKIITLCKKEMDVYNLKDVLYQIKKEKPDYFIHSGALTRPMIIHEKNPELSIKTNIIGTSNVVIACLKYNVKLIYISTDCVYEGIDGDYNEEEGVKPFNNYGWSKLGGECSVMLYPNSLIFRLGMLTNPFPHKKALADMKKSLLFDDEISKIILSLIDETGIINIGGEPQSVHDFVSRTQPEIEKIYLKDIHDVRMPSNSTMNITRMKNLMKKKSN